MRTLVTGVAGFTGPYVAALLADRGHEVHGIVNEFESKAVDGVDQVHVADITDLPRIASIVEKLRPDHVVHLAGIAFVPHADVRQLYHSNTLGTRQLLEALAGAARPPRSVLLASSAAVYGAQQEDVLDEDSKLTPANDYGVSKLAMEHVASLYGARLPLILARPFNYTGRGQSEKYIIPKIVAHARARAELIELGNIEVARDFSDVRDVAEIYCRLLEEARAIGGTYNVCSGRAVTLSGILEMVWKLSGHRFDICVDPSLLRPNEAKVLRGSSHRLQNVIGRISSIPFGDTLAWMLNG